MRTRWQVICQRTPEPVYWVLAHGFSTSSLGQFSSSYLLTLFATGSKHRPHILHLSAHSYRAKLVPRSYPDFRNAKRDNCLRGVSLVFVSRTFRVENRSLDNRQISYQIGRNNPREGKLAVRVTSASGKTHATSV